MSMGKILVADDDTNIAELLRLYLEKEGYSVVIAPDGEEAIAKFSHENPDLVLLDIMMPKLDGWQVCREIRKKSNCPIIMITAKGETFDKVLGLELGADDYVVKPFVPAELAARARSALRRTGRLSGAADPKGDDAPWTFGDLTLWPARFEARAAGRKVDLTATEFNLLVAMARRPGRVFTRHQRLDALRGPLHAVTDRAVDVQVVALRRKLGPCGDRIETVRGVGYRFADE